MGEGEKRNELKKRLS